MRVVHVYTMKREPSRVRVVAQEHAAYWERIHPRGYLGGPFADRSGGVITFEADSVDEAERLIAADPFVRGGLLESSLVRQWVLE